MHRTKRVNISSVWRYSLNQIFDRGFFAKIINGLAVIFARKFHHRFKLFLQKKPYHR